MMKRNKRNMYVSRALRHMLTLLLAIICLTEPWSFALRARADGAEFSTEGTAFSEPKHDTAMMYFWHKGLPSITKDKQGNYIKYPVLITWLDQYFLCADDNFKNELNETHTLQKKKNGHYIFMGGYIDNGYLSSDAFDHDDFDRVWGDTDYYMRYLYDTTDSGLLAKLGVDIDDLKTFGEAVSMSTASLPYLVPVDPEKDQYAIGLDEAVFGEDYWLVGRTRTWQRVPQTGLLFSYDDMQQGEVQWCLDYRRWSANRFCDKNYTYTSSRRMYDVDTHKEYEYNEGADQHYWTVKLDSSGLYHFWTLGENTIESWARISGTQGKELNRQRTRDWYHANDVGRVNLYYKGSQIGASTPTVKNKNWANRINTVDNTDGYSLYYADPNIVSFYRMPFTVEKGQVVNLDGPLVLDNPCTVTVKDGGVLSCSGWVINNGQIVVEPGGMLILQERDTATGDHQYGCISSLNVQAGTGSGRIACDGTIIINRDCKLTCAGCYGLKLGSSAQVVNYGQIIAENLEIYSDYIIENRGDSSAVFAGWGVTDSGYLLTRTRISGQTYNGKGTLENTAAVSVPKGAVYGEGAARFYVNSAGSVNYTQPNRKRGNVSDFIARIDGSSFVPPVDLPSGIPIHFDDRYGVAFIKLGDVIYQYHRLIDRWVNIAEGQKETFYSYRMPDAVEEYVYEYLPDGFILVSGLVVGQEFNEDVLYDWRAHVFWLTAGTNYYYYEKTLQKYIHVLSSSTYCVCPGELAPPPNYEHDFVPTSMYNELPLDAMFYQSGMTEVENPFGKPEVKVENGMYYVEIDGTKLLWNERYRRFLPRQFTIIDGEIQGGLTEDQVNWGYFDPDTAPDAKPKVQKEENRYYIIVATGDYPGKYYWYSSVKAFLLGDPVNYMGKPVNASDVDLNGYKLP